MSPRDSFWFLAGALVTIAILVGARAWFLGRPARGAPAPITSLAVPIAAALALIGVALGIYFLIGSPDSIHSSADVAVRGAVTGPLKQAQQSETNAGSLDEVTRKLAARLQANGGSDGEWKLLAQSYEYLGRSAEAQAARSHRVAPQSAPLAAPASRESGDTPVTAGEGPVASEQMAAIAAALDEPAAPHEVADLHAAPSQGNAPSQSIRISGSVNITSALAPQAPAGATLFIYAKQPNAAGPPLAVVRLRADHWPVQFTLSDANAMVPGRSLANANNVQLEARISQNGDALPRSGDLVGSVTSVNPRDGRLVRISIDRPIG